jgi:hypothetical protein
MTDSYRLPIIKSDINYILGLKSRNDYCPICGKKNNGYDGVCFECTRQGYFYENEDNAGKITRWFELDGHQISKDEAFDYVQKLIKIDEASHDRQ